MEECVHRALITWLSAKENRGTTPKWKIW